MIYQVQKLQYTTGCMKKATTVNQCTRSLHNCNILKPVYFLPGTVKHTVVNNILSKCWEDIDCALMKFKFLRQSFQIQQTCTYLQPIIQMLTWITSSRLYPSCFLCIREYTRSLIALHEKDCRLFSWACKF